MKKSLSKYIQQALSLVLLCFIYNTGTIEAQVFSSVDLNRKSVYIEQPFRVTVTVYTKTWFTAPVEFGNLQIPNTFIIPFDKTQPGMFTVGGKQYPGIQFYYIVFPYKAGNFTVPALELTVQSPPEGSSQAQKLTLKTTPQPFIVKDVPKELKSKGAWFVATNVTMHETWNPSSTDYKVGDVVKRIITIDAKGTLPQFIPDISKQEPLKWAGIYPQDPVLTDTRSGGDANGRSVQTITYLMEKAGDFTMPEISVSFWNPYTAKIETRSTGNVRIHVNDNPNLGILTTLKDSLKTTISAHATEAKAKTPFLILGIKWYQFAGGLAIALILLYFLIKWGRKGWLKIRSKREKYRNSEPYFFSRFQHTGKEPEAFVNALYSWWDHYNGKSFASVSKSLSAENKQKENEDFMRFLEKTVNHEKTDDPEKIKQELKKFRAEKEQQRLNKHRFENLFDNL
ncbi:MAG: BatD family protein [Tannerella sp.]|jgi:hypothetical protein|nr:BatD family protein [Tannerella sp.]